MKHHALHVSKAAAAAMAGLLWAGAVHAQAPAPLPDYPKQAITVVSPFPPGGRQ